LAVVVFGSLFLAEKLEVERFPISDGIVFGVLLFYEVVIPSLTRGYGLGRLATGTRIVSERDERPSSFFNHMGRFATRAGLFAFISVFVAYEVAMPAFVCVILIEATVGALHPRRQTLGDLVGRTVVVRRRST
jgi:uncharacterized RDD family membrane protein YckC